MEKGKEETGRVRSYPYMMSPNYCKEWTVEMAIREVLANALDTKTKVEARILETGTAIVSDRGDGMAARHLLLGQSEKGKNDIGQFGEGLKIAALVMCRNKRKFIVRSNGHQYEFKLKHNADFESDMLTVEVAAVVEKRVGTAVWFECTEDELQAAKDRFLKFAPRPVIDGDILNAPGMMYIGGVYVHKADALFGYNLTNKSLMNRDRSVLNHNDLAVAIANKLAYCHSKAVARRYWEAANLPEYRNVIEYANSFYTPKDRVAMWRSAFKEIYGDKVCLSDGEADARAAYLGYRVLKWQWAPKAMAQVVGVKTASQVAPAKDKAVNTKQTDLTEAERRNLEIAKNVCKKIRPGGGWWIQAKNGMDCLGQQEGNCLRIERKQLVSPEKACETLLHELAHWDGGGTDCTARFEATMTDYLGRLGAMLSAKK